MRAWTALISLALVVWVAETPCRAQCTGSEDAKLVASDGKDSDWLGSAVALSGDVAVLGAYNADTAAGTQAGKAYIYRFDGSTWVEERILTASDGGAGDTYGGCVAVDGSVVMVGADNWDIGGQGNVGQAYVYRYDGTQWVEEQKLTASDWTGDAFFGCGIALHGNLALIGSPGDDPGSAPWTGAVYAFRYDGTRWVEEQKFVASDGAAGDIFGVSFEFEGNVAVVGAELATTPAGRFAGAAYVFRYDGTQWVEEEKLTASDGGAGDQFGHQVDTDGSVVVVSAPGHTTVAGQYAGAVYVYRFDGLLWVEEQELIASDGADNDILGWSAAMQGFTIIAGAPLKTVNGQIWAGATYVFSWDGSRWVQESILEASDGVSFDELGTSVAMDQSSAVAGASRINTSGGLNAGGAYLFPIADLTLSTNQSSALPGDVLTFTTCGGFSGSLVGLFVVDVSGVGTFLHVDLSQFDAQGTWALNGTVPSGLSGLTMDFRSYGFHLPGVVGASGRAAVAFQ